MKYASFGGDSFKCVRCGNRKAIWFICKERSEYVGFLCNNCLINKKDILIYWYANKFYKTHKLYKIVE